MTSCSYFAGIDRASTSHSVCVLDAAGSVELRLDLPHNKEGIEHYNLGHWDVALKHFTAASKEDPQSAEAHYNVALALDKLGDHKAATEHFQTAKDLGKDNADIQNSGILKAHLKMK